MRPQTREPTRRLEDPAYLLLEVVVTKGVGEISYEHPANTLAKYFPGKDDAYFKQAIGEICAKDNDLFAPRSGFKFFGIGHGDQYHPKLDLLQKMYEEQHKLREIQAPNQTPPRT